MGGSSKKQTVGYRYSLGAHLALCHGPVDAIREIRVDDRTAWSIGIGEARSSEGAGAGAQKRLGTVASMSAVAGSGEEDTARVSFPGTLAGVRLGQRYALALAADETSRTVTLRSIAHDGENGLTAWHIEPAALAFAAQTVTVTETGAAASATGSGAVGGRIRIDKPELFGGEKREGGIVGDVDVLMGAPDQAQNDYLAARAGTGVPAYRGLCSLVLRQVYLDTLRWVFIAVALAGIGVAIYARWDDWRWGRR